MSTGASPHARREESPSGLDRIAINYTETTIEVTLFAGSRPNAATCIELAEKVVTVVELEDPVGDRELVDGALPD